MKRIILILTLFLFFINGCAYAATKISKQDLTVPALDGFSIRAVLEYPKIKGQKEYSTVVLLHSLGYSSQWWETLPADLMNQGYAVLRIDLRGHGRSIYNSKLVRTSWKSMTNTAFEKYPDDVVKVIEYIKKENSKLSFFNNWAIVGADIGGSSTILASDKLAVKPKTIVLLSPVVETKGLYIPVSLAHLDNVDIFSISGTGDSSSVEAEDYLKKFAQAAFVTYTSEARSTGMLMLKNDSSLAKIIATWINQYLK